MRSKKKETERFQEKNVKHAKVLSVINSIYQNVEFLEVALIQHVFPDGKKSNPFPL